MIRVKTITNTKVCEEVFNTFADAFAAVVDSTYTEACGRFIICDYEDGTHKYHRFKCDESGVRQLCGDRWLKVTRLSEYK